MRTRILRSCTALALTLSAGVAITGCSSAPDDVSASAVRGDLNPELRSHHQRTADVKNMVWHTWNYDWASARADFYRGGHLDRPHRLTKHPTPH